MLKCLLSPVRGGTGVRAGGERCHWLPEPHHELDNHVLHGPHLTVQSLQLWPLSDTCYGGGKATKHKVSSSETYFVLLKSMTCCTVLCNTGNFAQSMCLFPSWELRSFLHLLHTCSTLSHIGSSCLQGTDSAFFFFFFFHFLTFFLLFFFTFFKWQPTYQVEPAVYTD